MYNTTDIQFVGKHDYDKAKAEIFASCNGETFSINIYQLVLKGDGKSMKASKGLVRVSGSPLNKDKVFEMAESIVLKLDGGTWDGRKSVVVK